jgi:ATP dependent DNA ligase domain
MAFDLLYCDPRDLTARQLRDRRARLEDVVAGSELVFPVRRLAPDGLEAWKQVVERGYEGYVAKDEANAYEGGATRRWLKVKQKDLDGRGGPLAAANGEGWHLVVKGDDEKIRNLLLGLTGTVELDPFSGGGVDMVNEPIQSSLAHFEREVNRSIQETLMVISDDQAPDRTLLLQVLRNQVVVFAALSDLYHDVINLHASKS